MLIDVRSQPAVCRWPRRRARNIRWARWRTPGNRPSDKSVPVVLMCVSGARASRAAGLLKRGYENAVAVAGGTGRPGARPACRSSRRRPEARRRGCRGSCLAGPGPCRSRHNSVFLVAATAVDTMNSVRMYTTQVCPLLCPGQGAAEASAGVSRSTRFRGSRPGRARPHDRSDRSAHRAADLHRPDPRGRLR